MRYWRGFLAAAAIAVVVGLVYVGITAYHPFVPAPVPSVKLPSNIQWGMWSGTASDVRATTEELGKKPNIIVKFTGFADSYFPYNFADTCTNGQTLLVYWENIGEQYSIDKINAGSLDNYIHSFAQQAARDNCPIMLAPFHEMNGDWVPWSGTKKPNTPAKLIKAWRHIHDIFAKEAPNVKFAWVVNAGSFPNIPGNQPADYYPGDEYVDWVGLDGFNFNRQSDGWYTVPMIYDDPVRQVLAFKKPLCICSIGSAPGPMRPAWIREGFAHIGAYPNVVALVYFNEDKHSEGVNWRFDGDADTLRAFKDVLPE